MININTLIDEKYDNNKILKINERSVKIKRTLTAVEFMAFVNLVVNSSFDSDEKYHASYKEIALRYAIVNYFTDIDISELSANEIYDITNQYWYSDVSAYVQKLNCYNKLVKAINEDIDYKIKTDRTSFDDFIVFIKNIIEKITEQIDNTDMDSIKSLAESLSNINEVRLARALADMKKNNDEVN